MNNNIDHSNSPVTLKINIPDKGIYEKRFSFKSDENVWSVKEHVIHEIGGKELKDIQNYGIFVPPCQGKAGKFMDEGRPLSEYSIPGNDQVLEFMLKRRIYRSISFDENKLTKIHTKANLKKLMEMVESNNAGQVNQFLEKGLDPNFLDPKTGESPLTTAAVKNNANEIIMFLINGGAYFDLKNRDGLTAVHKAASAGNSHNIKVFLDLGASPNYRDLKGLTPLYHACLSGKNPNVAELLLGDQADIGVVDSQGWQEVHQVCRYGHVRHLEQLIYYGADLNAQNGSGNTPLHICALYNQEDCARLLLYRGARRDIFNFANQTAEMVAVVATNVKLSTFIRNYSEKDVVPYIEKPTYSTRRRQSSKSRPTANSVFLRDSTDNFIYCSESLSITSSTPSLHSETSEPMSLDLSPRDTVPLLQVTEEEKSPTRKYRRTRTMSGSGSDSSYATDSGDEGGSNLTTPLVSPTSDELNMRWRTYSLSSLNKEERGNIPKIREVKGAANMGPHPGKSNSRKTYVAVTNFNPTQAGELSLAEGDLVEVITKGKKGYWQGSVAGKTGWFPAAYVEDLKKRKNKGKILLHKPASIGSSLNKSNSSLDQPYNAPVMTTPQPRQVILHKQSAGGFGFQMRGANVPAVNRLEFQPAAKIPALQYIGDVEPGGEAEKRGVKKGDYILEVNGDDVSTASHRHVVNLIRKTGQTLVMKLITVDSGEHNHKTANNVAKSGMPVSVVGTNGIGTTGLPPSAEHPPNMPPPPDHQLSVEPNKPSSVIVNGTDHVDGPRDKKPPPIPSRAPTTSLSNRPKPVRQSVTDVDFENSAKVQEDRVISVPRERIPSAEQQWHSPLTGSNSLPRRPKSSYGAIIGSPHVSPSYESSSRNFHPVDSLDNTGFTTLPSKPGSGDTRRYVSQDDSAVVRRRPGSARSARDRPKSWMPKVLPTEPPPVLRHNAGHNKQSPEELPKHNDDSKHASKGSEGKKDKKRRFSFRKRKEKDYIPSTIPEPAAPSEEPAVEDDVSSGIATENLHIEEEQTRPASLPGLHKRLSTFKPVTIPHRQVVHTEAVSPELSQALEKRKSRGHSSSTDELGSPVSSPGNDGRVPVLPMPTHPPPNPPRAKTLEESIREEMMRRRTNTASASAIPSKPRRTFEYKKPDGEQIPEETEPRGEKSDLDSELAKAIAKRAAKMSSAPAGDTHIYENVKHLQINSPTEPRSSVEEPPALSIEEKLKRLHLHSEVILPTKFKPPIQAPPARKAKNKKPVAIPPVDVAQSKDISPEVSPSGKSTSPNNVPGAKVPPKTLPKPQRKSASLTSDSGSEDVVTSRPTTLPLVTSKQNASLAPPVLSPEMVATKLLDDVIDEEVKRSNWDTASWKEKDFSSEKSSPASAEGPPAAAQSVVHGGSQSVPVASPPTSKKKYVYKITLVTEKSADGSEVTQKVTQVITNEKPAEKLESHGEPQGEYEFPPPPPPLEFLDESSVHAPVFTPPASPSQPPEFSASPPQFSPPPPPPTFSPPPPPIVDEPPSEEIPPPLVPAPVDFQGEKASNEGPKELPDESVTPEAPSSSQDINQPLPPETLPPPLQSEDNLPPGEIETTSFTSDLPPPIIPPPTEVPLPSGAVTPPKEFMETNVNKEANNILVPPAVSTGSSNGLDAEHKAETDSSRPPELAEIKDTKTSTGVCDNVVSDVTIHAVPEPETTSESPNGSSNRAEEIPSDQSDGLAPLTSTISSQQQAAPETTASGGPNEVVVPTHESRSRGGPDVEVPAPPREVADQNEQLVEAPTANTAIEEEQASPKTVQSDVSTDSLSFRDTQHENWTCEHVCQWLDSIGLPEHQDLFRENDIRGSNLVGLTKEDLRELGVKKLGHRMTIANELSRLTSNNGAATNL